MKKNHVYFSSVLDSYFFSAVIYFVLYYVFLTKQNKTTALLLSLICTALCVYILFTLILRIRLQKLAKQEFFYVNERILFALLIADREEQASIARKLYGPGNYVFLPVCPDETVTKNDIIRTTFEQDRACTLITVASIGGKVLSFSKEIPQIKEIIDGEKLIANMRKKQIYPSVQGVISITATGKTPIVKIMKTVLSKENTVRYLRYACIMSVGALFTHFNIYYTVSACILLGLSLASFIRNKRQSRKIF